MRYTQTGQNNWAAKVGPVNYAERERMRGPIISDHRKKNTGKKYVVLIAAAVAIIWYLI